VHLVRSALKLLIISALLMPGRAFAHSDETDQALQQVQGERQQPQNSPMGVAEHLGAKIPLGLTFRDETGTSVTLAQLVSGPTIILPVFYRCTNVCSALQAHMASALQRLELQPGVDYRVISVSFDEQESPVMASRSKQAYLSAMNRPFPADGWRFLTGDKAAIHDLTDSMGFSFERRGADFSHPVVSILVDKNGTIIRYLYGAAVLPKDLALAVTEARSGVAGTSIRKVMDYCFTYDPAGKTYVFNLLRVSATAVILTAGGFFAYLLISGKKQRPHSGDKA
jgi:protein SCO1/2